MNNLQTLVLQIQISHKSTHKALICLAFLGENTCIQDDMIPDLQIQIYKIKTSCETGLETHR